MHVRRLNTLAILCLTILSADLLTEVMVHWAEHWTKSPNVYKTTAISMLAAVVVFYPAFEFMDSVVKKMASKYVGKTKSATGGGYLGLMIAFFVALAVLYGLYLKVHYNINLIKKIF